MSINENLTSKAQSIINKVLESKNAAIYAINPDGSIMELQGGCTLLNVDRNQMEIYIGDNANDIR